jgi:two-component system, NarL family, sensor histidine kinase DesK
LRECLTNIVKHSQAKICMITGEMTNEWFELHIEDDGVGFSRGDTDGNGLASIQERMRLLKGHAELGASSHGGVSVTLRLPVNEQERGNSQ